MLLFQWYTPKVVRSAHFWQFVPPSQHPHLSHNVVGSGLLSHYYNDSLALALRTIYEDHHWDDWRFNAAGSLAEKP
jgi:hypothetical protein